MSGVRGPLAARGEPGADGALRALPQRDVLAQALAFWQPRMLGAPLGVALWAVLGFFNGISRPRIAVMTTGLVAIVNAALNWLFIFKLDGGIEHEVLAMESYVFGREMALDVAEGTTPTGWGARAGLTFLFPEKK